MLQYLDKLQLEDMDNLIQKKEVQKQLMKDVAKANEVSSYIVNYQSINTFYHQDINYYIITVVYKIVLCSIITCFCRRSYDKEK